MNTKNNTIYITTALPYVNGLPHIGHTLEFLQADSIVRYYRNKFGRENVFFNTGTDENGLKVFQKAEAEGLTPKNYVDKFAKEWEKFCELFSISYDFFYRTSENYHIAPAQKFWNTCLEKGDIYKKKYEGLYCVGCEEFKTEKELVNGKCPLHNTEPIKYSEENYFFKLSKYKDQLLNYINNNLEFIKPEFKREELINFVKGMEDISISRLKENLPWGIPVPGDDSQVMYVWFDALTNYANSVGFGSDEEKFKKWWPGIQLCGPDNLRFQGGIWQGMLASAGLDFTKKILVHGMVLASDGTKMSKTIGNVISPFEQLEKYGIDVVRYYMLGILSTYADVSYSENDLKAYYNSNLANNFGNLLNRVTHLSNKKNVQINNWDTVSTEFKKIVDEKRIKVEKFFTEFEIKSACDEINDLANIGNKYIDENKPWNEESIEKVQEVLNNISYLLHNVIELYEPIIPTGTERARKALEERNTEIVFPKIL